MSRNIRKFVANIVSAFVSDKFERRRIRVNITAPLGRCMRFVRAQHKDVKDIKLKTFYGGGGKGLLIAVNDIAVYKFSCLRNGNHIAQREYDVVSYFKDKIPVYVPDVVLLKDGNNLVRKYEFIKGTLLSELPQDVLDKNMDYLARQIAEILYIMGRSDPDELKQYKANPNDTPQMFYGWNHGDFINGGNFFVDMSTMKLTAIIDWENAKFGDFYQYMMRSRGRSMAAAIIHEYTKLWNAQETSTR